MSTTAIAISSAAAVNASIAAAEARKAHKLLCENTMAAYDAKTATVEQARTYASCVQEVYPTPQTETPMVVKVGAAFMLVAMVVGFLHGTSEDGPVFGALCGAGLAIGVGFVYALIMFCVALIVG
jgi:hypothetical protein